MGQKYNSFVEHIHARSAALTEFRILCQALRRMAYCVYIGVSAVNVGMYAIHVPLLLDKGCLFGVPSNRVCGRWECLHTPRLLAQIRYSWLRSGVDIGFDQALLLVFEPRVGKWVYMNNLYIYVDAPSMHCLDAIGSFAGTALLRREKASACPFVLVGSNPVVLTLVAEPRCKTPGLPLVGSSWICAQL